MMIAEEYLGRSRLLRRPKSGLIQKVLDSCDRATALGRRDHAILMILAKLGLRATEVATLTSTISNWRSGEMLVRAEGRRRARMPVAWATLPTERRAT
jgi:site-specific recombinase XerC